MKKQFLKKAMSIAVAFAMTQGAFGVVVNAEENYFERGNDFEIYEAGILPDEILNSNPLNSIFEGDKVTVETDSLTGSKAIKFDIGNADATGTRFYLPLGENLTSGKYKISYKFRAENHSKCIDYLGAVVSENDNYGNTYIARSQVDTNEWYYFVYAGGVATGMIPNIAAEDYVTVEYVVNADTRYYDLYINGERIYQDIYPAAGGTGVSQLYFQFAGSARCGTASDATPKSAQTAENRGIYWVDDIKVEKLSIEPYKAVASDSANLTVEFNAPLGDVTADNFEIRNGDKTVKINSVSVSDRTLTVNADMKENTMYKFVSKAGVTSTDTACATSADEKAITFKTPIDKSDKLFVLDFEDKAIGTNMGSGYLAPGTKAGVVLDKTTGSKAFRIAHKGNDAERVFGIPDFSGGIYEYSYSMRFANHASGFLYMGNPDASSSSWLAYVATNTVRDNIYFTHSSTANCKTTNVSAYKDKYLNVKQIINFIDKTVDFYENDVYVGTKTFGTDSMKNMRFTIAPGAYVNEYGSANGTAIYYIDDIYVKQVKLDVLEATPDITEEVPLESDISVKFNATIDASALNEDNFGLYCDGDWADFTLEADSNDASIIYIKPVDGLKLGSNYEVTVSKDVTATGTLPMDEDYSFTFKTVTKLADKVIFAEDFAKYNEGDGYAQLGSGWSDNTYVRVDPVTGSKAVKLTVEDGHDNILYVKGIGQSLSTGKYKFSFKLRAENHSKSIQHMGVWGAGTGVHALAYKDDASLGFFAGDRFNLIEQAKDKYVEIEYVVDFDNDIYYGFCDGKLLIKQAMTQEYLDKFYFYLKDDTAYGYNGSETGTGVYWIDDLKVTEYNYPIVVKTTPDDWNGERKQFVREYLKPGISVELAMDKDLLASSVNKDNVKIYIGGNAIAADEYDVSYNNKVISVSVIKELEKETIGEIVLADGIKTADNLYGFEKGYTYKFYVNYDLDGVADYTVLYENDNITIDVIFDAEVEESEITKENIILTCGREVVDYTVSAVENGVKLTLKNEITTEDSYQLSINIADKCDFETIFSVPKPITTENVLLKNSNGDIIDRVSNVKDGKVTFTAEVKNNTYKSGKTVNIVTAIYNDGKLYATKITPATIEFEGTYSLNETMTVPTEGLNEKWTTAMFVWDDDMITPLVKKKINLSE